MLTVAKLRRKPRHFARLTGLTPEQFDDLLRSLRPVYQRQQAAGHATRGARVDRLRACGGGRRFNLAVGERLLSTLLYYRLHVTGTLLSYLFALDESNLCRERNHRMLPALHEVLPTPMQDHLLWALDNANANANAKPRKRIGTLEELLQAHPELQDIWIDATEQEVPKPQDKTRKKQLFSGKSHCHTLKTQLVTSGRLILHAFGGVGGSLHDRQLLRASGVMRTLPAPDSDSAKRKVRLDRGYCGAETEWQEVKSIEIVIGVKGTRYRKVTALGRALNHVLAKTRMQVEQNIGHLKNWRVLSGLYRSQHARYLDVTCVVAGLHNFKLLPGGAW